MLGPGPSLRSAIYHDGHRGFSRARHHTRQRPSVGSGDSQSPWQPTNAVQLPRPKPGRC